MAIQTWLMVEMLLRNKAQWKAEQKHERERMAVKWELMSGEWNQ